MPYIIFGLFAFGLYEFVGAIALLYAVGSSLLLIPAYWYYERCLRNAGLLPSQRFQKIYDDAVAKQKLQKENFDIYCAERKILKEKCEASQRRVERAVNEYYEFEEFGDNLEVKKEPELDPYGIPYL